jgi:uncharacterized protein
MAIEPEKIEVMVDESGSVTALLYSASRKTRAGITVILGHGAGGNQMSQFMRLFASELSTRGFDVMTFNFLYSERGRRVPDPKAKLEACYGAVIAAAVDDKKLKGNRLVIGGKSMGGRIASQVAAGEANNEGLPKVDDVLPQGRATAPLAGLVFLGYPLHPPGKPEQLRDAHLKDVNAPMLFLQGTRDAFGTADEISSVIKRNNLPATLFPIEGGDHSFKVAKGPGASQQQVYESMLAEIAQWLRSM